MHAIDTTTSDPTAALSTNSAGCGAREGPRGAVSGCAVGVAADGFEEGRQSEGERAKGWRPAARPAALPQLPPPP
jgi:hypothetical protein